MTPALGTADVRIVLPASAADRVDPVRTRAEMAVVRLIADLALPLTAAPPTVDTGEHLEVLVNGFSCAVPALGHLVRHSSDLEDRIAQAIHLNARHLVTPEVADAIWKSVTVSPAPPRLSGPPGVVPRPRSRSHPASGPAHPARAATRSRNAARFGEVVRVRPLRVQPTRDPGRREVLSGPQRRRRRLAHAVRLPLHRPDRGTRCSAPISRIEVDPDLPDHHHAIQVGDLRTLPLPGIPSGQLLVNDTSERLALLGLPDLDPQPVINPATGQPASLVPSAARDALEEAGLTTWNRRGYVILAAAEVVRRNAAALYHERLVRHQLNRLKADDRTLWPTVEALGGVSVLTRLLRRLVREQVPLHRLPAIITGLYESAPPIRDEPTLSKITTRRHRVDVVAAPEVGDAVEASLAETVRGILASAITNQATRSSGTLVVYLLDPAVERRLRDPAELRSDECRALLDMISDELILLPPTASLPVILTRAPLRARLRRVLEVEQPRLKVVAYEELSGDVNVQPVARLSLHT